MDFAHRGLWKVPSCAPAVIAVALLACGATPAHAMPRTQIQTQTGPDVLEPARTQAPPAPQAPPATRETRDVSHAPLGMVGWTYSSVIRNGVVANINLSRGQDVKGEDAMLWRGLQVTGTVGRLGFEAGAGYARMMIAAQFPLGYEFRGLAGRTWMTSGSLAPGDVYAGGEATLMFAVIRFTAGLIVPVTGAASHRPVLTGSVGIVLFLTKWTKAERKAPPIPGK